VVTPEKGTPAKEADDERPPPPRSFWVELAAKLVSVVTALGLVVSLYFGLHQLWTSFWGTPHASSLEPDPNYQFPVALGNFAAIHHEFRVQRRVLKAHGSAFGVVFAVKLRVAGGSQTTCTVRWSAHDPKSLNATVPLPEWAPTSERLTPCDEDGFREIWIPLPQTVEFVQYRFTLRKGERPTGALLDIGDTREIPLSSG
jgi:hypothetical protein